jgi:hypothetical protein
MILLGTPCIYIYMMGNRQGTIQELGGGVQMTSLPRLCYDAFGVIGTTFRELDWKTLIFFERAVPITPNTCYARHVAVRALHAGAGKGGHMVLPRPRVSAAPRNSFWTPTNSLHKSFTIRSTSWECGSVALSFQKWSDQIC